MDAFLLEFVSDLANQNKVSYNCNSGNVQLS